MSKKKREPKPEPKMDQEVAVELGWAYETTAQVVDAIKDLEEQLKGRLPGREFSIALTKLEEAEMWLARGFETAGFEEIPVPEEEEEEEGDEDEDEDEDEEGLDA
jgi:hypothetical protein